MSSCWIGKIDADDGHGKFEEDGPLIHFDCFRDFFYIDQLFISRKKANFDAGRRDVLNTVLNYVEQEVNK